jgi:tRNA dimethylallyltransferase
MDEAAEDIRRESRRYAKRQLTWLRRGDYHWIRFHKTPDLEAARRDSTDFLAAHGVE